MEKIRKTFVLNDLFEKLNKLDDDSKFVVCITRIEGEKEEERLFHSCFMNKFNESNLPICFEEWKKNLGKKEEKKVEEEKIEEVSKVDDFNEKFNEAILGDREKESEDVEMVSNVEYYPPEKE